MYIDCLPCVFVFVRVRATGMPDLEEKTGEGQEPEAGADETPAAEA